MLALLDTPTKGKILLNNKDTKHFNEEEKNSTRKNDISIIFQDNNLLTDFTALENVIMPLIIKGINTDRAMEKAKKILKDVKILNRINHFPNELSGGEQQRVAIARALISETDFNTFVFSILLLLLVIAFASSGIGYCSSYCL